MINMAQNDSLKQMLTWKWLYLIAGILIAALLVNPIAFPADVKRWTLAYYNFVEDLPPGSLVLFSPGFDAAAWSELGYATEGMLKQLWANEIDVIIVGFSPDAPVMAARVLGILDPWIQTNNIVYGQDYVSLPMIPGGTASGGAALAISGNALLSKDIHGTPVSDLPILQRFNSYQDIALCIGIDMSSGGEWVNQWYLPYNIPVAGCGPTTGMHTTVSNFDAGMFIGAVIGLTGTSEFEFLLGEYTLASGKAAIINVTMLMLPIIAIIVNIHYFATKKKGSE